MAQWVKNPTAAVWIAAVAHIKSLAWELPYAVDVFIIFFFFFYAFSGPHLQYMEVPRLGVKLGLQLLAYTTATAMGYPNLICDLYHSSWQHRILYPLSEARD